ncbi:MAG: ComEC/Rec2 family competence protein [Sulfuricurvum sp.]|uniref:ComEC/Rec2 family competence protein n=1 Tax=Sulfuricurvum sp. TaxID=2025608 RepID=UPI002631EAF7|nr:ComEC/Rec2 family competence protein [Sulfuricurvum sp.]MDD2369821.1 ComEC/Rec2 family competence protein [Sulfuricurvum sp.]MDD2950294.1 ComEC/Rec2 family competence protein [Sulfuricurvum sp.]MDD5117532.1 ComEC/Rec2 family competence protein [Sulfuricurvum sp.]
MSKLERVELFDFKSGSFFFIMLLFITSLSLGWEYFRYKDFVKFDDPLIRAEVIDQEVRLISEKPKTSIKFRLENGANVRCIMSPYLRDLRGREVLLELQVAKVSFLDYLKGFRTRGAIYEVYPSLSLKEQWYRRIASQHSDQSMKELYGALFVNSPMSQEFQSLIGAMGLSAVLSISGYHFGILSLIAYFFLRTPYRFVQNRYFPYRHGNRDLFLVVGGLLFAYLSILEYNPAMIRSFGMIIVGYCLYDRGIKIISSQTLMIAIGLLLAFFPRLFFSLSFWFSSFGVLSIFIFIRYYEHWKPWQIFLALNIWCYLVLLPISLAIFGTFSWWHIGSIPINLIFNLYYPSVLALHMSPWADLFDAGLIKMFDSGELRNVVIPMWVGILSIVLALSAMRWKGSFWALGVLGFATLGSAVYQIA